MIFQVRTQREYICQAFVLYGGQWLHAECWDCDYPRDGTKQIIWNEVTDTLPSSPGGIDMDGLHMVWNTQNREIYARETGLLPCVRVDIDDDERESERHQDEKAPHEGYLPVCCRWCGKFKCNSGVDCKLRAMV